MPAEPAHIERFKADLQSLAVADIFDRYIAAERCEGLVGIDHLALRQRIANHFGLEVEEVVIVGSAKLGFTLMDKPRRDSDEGDRPAFSPFSDASDVDVAIVSDRLFDDIWKQCFDFWHTSGYGNDLNYWPTGRKFRDYIFRGWMRPDKLPSEGGFRYKNEWFEFFRRLTSERGAGDYRISAGLYREAYFLRTYQQAALAKCRARLGAAI